MSWAWSHPFLKATSPTGQDPDGAQVHGHLALCPGHVSPRAGMPGTRVMGRGMSGPRTPGLPLTNQPDVQPLSGPQFSHHPSGNNCNSHLGSSEAESQGVWHIGGAQNRVLLPGEGLETSARGKQMENSDNKAASSGSCPRLSLALCPQFLSTASQVEY